MNIPNLLTISRIILTIFFIRFYLLSTFASTVWALIIFTAAALTDYFDGYLARKVNQISGFGKIMDPIADKFLTLSAFYIFAQFQLIPFWMFIVIAVREVGITVLRLNAMRAGAHLAAESAGKLKTVLQITAIYLIMIITVAGQLTNMSHQFYVGLNGLMWFVVVITLWSGASFIGNNRKELFHVG